MRPDQERFPDRWAPRWKRALDYLAHEGFTGLFTVMREHSIAEMVTFVARNIRYQIGIYFARIFDAKHHVDTAGAIPAQFLSVPDGDPDQAYEFLSVSPRACRRMLSRLPADLSTFTFIDYGSGKGRALLIASEYGFGAIRGVEFAQELVDISRKNIQTLRTRHLLDIDVICADATKYQPPSTPCVFFFFSPFRYETLEQVAKSIKRSYEQKPRKMIVIYAGEVARNFPMGEPIWAQLGFLKRTRQERIRFLVDAVRPIQYHMYEST
jgi:SAM-dependent methyltransferase